MPLAIDIPINKPNRIPVKVKAFRKLFNVPVDKEVFVYVTGNIIINDKSACVYEWKVSKDLTIQANTSDHFFPLVFNKPVLITIEYHNDFL